MLRRSRTSHPHRFFMSKNYLTLLIFFASYLWLNFFSKSILPTHFLDQGIDFKEQALGFVFVFLPQIILILSFRKFSSRIAWYLSPIFFFASILLLIRITGSLQFYLSAVLSGCSLTFFFILYNVAHFQKTEQKNIGKSSALMFSLFPAINIAAPLLAGFLAQINSLFLWIGSFVSFLITIFLVSKQANIEVSYTVKKALAELKPTRLLIFLEGIWEALPFAIVPIYTLYFIQTPAFYGTFLAYLAGAGLVANLVLGRFTDKVQKRAVFLYPITISLALITFLFPTTTQNIFYWALAAGAIQFLLPLFWNLTTAMIVDTSPNLILAIPGRELTLASGRILGVFLVFLSFSLEKTPHYIFFILGVVMLLYPATLYWKTKISKQYKYL